MKATMGSECDDEKTAIRKIFDNEGLNGKTWIPKVKQYLKLDNIILLKHVKEKEFEEFVDQIENPAEKTALRVIFKTIKSRRQHPEEDEACKQAAKSFLEKERGSAKVDSTSILSKVTEELKAHNTYVPDGFGTMPNRKEAIRSEIDNIMPTNSVSTGVKENWTASEAVRKIEAGVLCKGFYFTGNINDIRFGKEVVINVKDSLEYKGNFSKQKIFHEKFSSQEMTDRFERDIDKLSSSWAVSAQAGLMVAKRGSFQKATIKEDVMDRQEKKQSSYCSVVYCDKAPVKSVEIGAKDIELTSDVLEALQSIEKTVKECNYESKAHFHEFFETYGSHVGIGEIELGGVLMSTAYCSGFQEVERSKVEGIVSEASELSLSVGFSKAGIVELGLGTSFNAAKLHDRSSKKYDSKDFRTTSVKLDKIGGPVEIDDKTEWKKELVKYSSLWRIVSRNTPPKPIWELLKNHGDEFEDCDRLCDAMETDWENAQEEDKYSRMIQVRKWVQKSNRAEEKVVSHAKDLHQLREKYYPNDLLQLWHNEVLYSVEVQRILTRIAKNLPTEISRKEHAKTSLSSVLQPYERISISDFCTIDEILKYVKAAETDIVLGSFKVESVEELIKVLKEELEDIEKQNHSYDLQRIHEKLKLLITDWSEKYNNQPSYILTTLLTSFRFRGFHSDFHFNSLSEIKNLLLRLIETHSEFKQIEDNLEQQAYIVNLALNSPQHQRQEAVMFVVRSLGESLSDIIRKSCQKALRKDNAYNTEKLTESITDLLRETKVIRSLEAQLKFLEPHTVTARKEAVHTHEDLNLNEETARVLEELRMTKYYPQKLTYQDVIMITVDVLDDKKRPTTLPELPWYFIKHIMALDSDTRENSRVKTDIATDDSEGDEESDTETATDTATDNSSDSDSNHYEAPLYLMENKMHPLDLIYIIFLCADDFLRQELADRMVKCQYAIPFILPPAEHLTSPQKSLFLIWALQTISRVFKKHGTTKHSTLVKEDTPLITSLSLGEESSWTSRLLNEMLSSHQETFWNQTLPGGDCRQRVSEGMVEVAWYLPGGFDDDKSKVPLMFANVRGNAVHHPTVTDTLMNLSAATLIFAQDMETAEKFLSKRKPLENVILILLYRGKDVEEVELTSKKLRKRFKLKKRQVICKIAEDSNFSTVLDELGKSVAEVMKKGQLTSLARIASHVRQDGCLETDDHLSTTARKAAEKILIEIDEIHRRQPWTVKHKIFPLQSDVLERQEIAYLDKELCRQNKWTRKETIQNYAFEIQKKKWKLQFQQLQKPISDTFKDFLKCLLSLDSTGRKYFLQCLRLGLNERSTQHLYPLYEQFCECRKEAGSPERDERLKEIDEQLRQGSLGLEHFFRELSIMYECIAALEEKVSSKFFDEKLNCLAALMGDMLLEGEAIEIMDGDVVHVPVVWLQAVLKQIDGVNRSRLLKVAVLGAQSSGKSTLLNTVFGLNFPVSSGRCTRGAYAQLVKVEEKFRETMKCEFILVIDSEGLKSPVKKTSRNFDNELATFVAGISDITLVIFKGEDTEMKNILPLAIHVFLRMNVIGQTQSCYFVHQNTRAVEELRELDTEIDSLVNELDEKTYAAVVDTGQSHKYTKFSDVLQYNSNTDNLYVSGLLTGAQTMAKIDVQYSNKMQKLKYDIIQSKHLGNRNMCGTLTDFGMRMRELWEAIKRENFVLNFRNVLAIEVHRKMQKIFNDAQWDVKKDVREKIKEEININENDIKDPHRANTIPEMIKKSAKNLEEYIAIKIAGMKERIQRYFDCDGCDVCKSLNIERRHILANHQEEFQNDIDTLKKTLSKEANNAVDLLKDKLMVKVSIDDTSNKMGQALRKFIKEEQVERIFNDLSPDAIGDIMKEARDNAEKDPDIEAEVQSVIKGILGKESSEYIHVITRENQDNREDRHRFVVDKVEHLRPKAVMFKCNYVSDSDAQCLEDLTNTTIVETIKNLSQCEGKQFNETDAETVFSEILQKINKKFEITTRFKTDMLRYAENMAVPVFMKMHGLYLENSFPEALPRKKKKSFQNLLGEVDVAPESCENVIKEMLRLNVEKSMSCTDLLHELRNCRGGVFKNIKELEKSIAIDLFKEKKLGNHIYISDYEKFMKAKITEKSRQYFGQYNRYKEIATKKLEQITKTILNTLDDDASFVQLYIQSLTIQHDNDSGLSELNFMDEVQFRRIIRRKIQMTIKNDIIQWINSWDIAKKLEEKCFAEFTFKELARCSEYMFLEGVSHSVTFNRSGFVEVRNPFFSGGIVYKNAFQ